MYTKITDPSTGKLHLIHSVKGNEIIQGYLSHLKGGSNKILEKLHKQLKKAQQKVDLIKNKINKLQIGGSGAIPSPDTKVVPVVPVVPTGGQGAVPVVPGGNGALVVPTGGQGAVPVVPTATKVAHTSSLPPGRHPPAPIDLSTRTGILTPAMAARRTFLRGIYSGNGRRLTSSEVREIEIANLNDMLSPRKILEMENNSLPPDFEP